MSQRLDPDRATEGGNSHHRCSLVQVAESQFGRNLGLMLPPIDTVPVDEAFKKGRSRDNVSCARNVHVRNYDHCSATSS